MEREYEANPKDTLIVWSAYDSLPDSVDREVGFEINFKVENGQSGPTDDDLKYCRKLLIGDVCTQVYVRRWAQTKMAHSAKIAHLWEIKVNGALADHGDIPH